MIMSIPIDSFVFFYNLYTKPVGDDHDEDKSMITDNGLEQFRISCSECLKATKQETGNFSSSKVKFNKLNKLLQQKLYIRD